MNPPAALTAPSFTFSSPDGLVLVKNILITECQLPYEPHTYQLQGVCKALDGVDVLKRPTDGLCRKPTELIVVEVMLALCETKILVDAANCVA